MFFDTLRSDEKKSVGNCVLCFLLVLLWLLRNKQIPMVSIRDMIYEYFLIQVDRQSISDFYLRFGGERLEHGGGRHVQIVVWWSIMPSDLEKGTGSLWMDPVRYQLVARATIQWLHGLAGRSVEAVSWRSQLIVVVTVLFNEHRIIGVEFRQADARATTGPLAILSSEHDIFWFELLIVLLKSN